MQQVTAKSIFNDDYKIIEKDVSPLKMRRIRHKLLIKKLSVIFYDSMFIVLILFLTIAILHQFSVKSIFYAINAFNIALLVALFLKRDKIHEKYRKSLSDYFKLIFRSKIIDEFNSVYFSTNSFIEVDEYIESGLLSANGILKENLDISSYNHLGFIIDNSKVEISNLNCIIKDSYKVHFKGIIGKVEVPVELDNNLLFLPQEDENQNKYSESSIKCGGWYYNDKHEIKINEYDHAFINGLTLMSTDFVNYDLDRFTLYVISSVLNKYTGLGISIQDNIIYFAYRTEDVFIKDEFVSEEQFSKLTVFISDLMVLKNRIRLS